MQIEKLNSPFPHHEHRVLFRAGGVDLAVHAENSGDILTATNALLRETIDVKEIQVYSFADDDWRTV